VNEPLPLMQAEHAVIGRRRFLGWVIGAIGAFVATAAGIPIVGAVVSPAFGQREKTTVRLDKLTSYRIGEPTLAQFTVTRTDGWLRTPESRGVWVIRTGAQDVTVYNGRCTHLGCAYSWQTQGPNSDHFVCPCHDGVFALHGSVVSGPPPRPLDTLPATVEDGVVVITYQDFRPGVPDKTEV
jgi:menaquinol-cytochrome c reductase iron-sulfur subunit